jgi:hypothetical protein
MPLSCGCDEQTVPREEQAVPREKPVVPRDEQGGPDGCYMNGATTSDGELALLTMSLHHRREGNGAPGDTGPLFTSDFPPLADEIVQLWPNPNNLVILLVNAPPRGGDLCMENPVHCLRDELEERYHVSLDAKEVLWTAGFSGQMGIIAGHDWMIRESTAELFPDWVMKHDPGPAALSSEHCPEGSEIKHFGKFQIQQRSNPDNILHFYSLYLCTLKGYDGEPKLKKFRYLMNRLTNEPSGQFAPFIAGDWNIFARRFYDTPPNSLSSFVVNWPLDEFEFWRDSDLAFTAQQEVRDRMTWIDDLDATKCELPAGGDVRSFSWSESKVHLAQVNQVNGGKLLTPVYHPYWTKNLPEGVPQPATVVAFSNVAHYAYLTIFRMEGLEPKSPTTLAGLPIQMHASALGHGPLCTMNGVSSVSGGAGCSVVASPEWKPPAASGLRIGISGYAMAPSQLRVEAKGEYRLILYGGAQPISPGPMNVTLHDETFNLGGGNFCQEVVVSALKDRKLEVRVSIEAAPHPLFIDTITITDLGGDPCSVVGEGTSTEGNSGGSLPPPPCDLLDPMIEDCVATCLSSCRELSPRTPVLACLRKCKTQCCG